MHTFRLTFLLFTIIIIEGYIVLSTELLAIRLTIPFIGSGTDTISIIIAAVLIPLAFGYHAGGSFKPGFRNGKFVSIRNKLILNMQISLIILLVGLSYYPLTTFFYTLIAEDIVNRLVLSTLYAVLFLATPVYLLGQTVPLISNYFSKEHLSKITGKMLFFSTVGSFLGAVFSTLVLMSYIGVHYTAVTNFVLLGLLITLLSKRKFNEQILAVWGMVAIGFMLNSQSVMDRMNIVENNKYNTVIVQESKNERYMILNNNSSSMLSDSGRRHEYIEFMERVAIAPIWHSDTPRDILVLGAGAFTIGHHDRNNHYDFVDIDPRLQPLAEEYILKEKLADNKTFHPVPARAFLAQTKKKYDVIILDTYLGATSIPEHLVTREYFTQVKNALKPDGIMLGNFIASGNFNNALTRNIDTTLHAVFPHLSRHVIDDSYNLWSAENLNNTNIIYIYKNRPAEEETLTIYTDDKNTLFRDKPVNIRQKSKK